MLQSCVTHASNDTRDGRGRVCRCWRKLAPLPMILFMFLPSTSPELHTACVGLAVQNAVAASALTARHSMAMHSTAAAPAARLQFIAAMLSKAVHWRSLISVSITSPNSNTCLISCCVVQYWCAKAQPG